MAISPEVAGLAVSVVSGALKLGKRLDEIQAEETALRAAIPLAFPDVVDNPRDAQLRSALRRLLRQTKDASPDPLGGDERAGITALLAESDVYDDLFAACARHHLLETIATRRFRPDDAFKQALLSRNSAWDLADAEVAQYTYFVAAGAERRAGSLGFRIGAAVLDVLAEVAAQNARFVLHDEPTRRLVQTVLVRFSEPDLASMAGWGAVLQGALRATLNTAIDERDVLAGGHVWLEHALSAVARARDLAPNGDDFVLGLFQGRGTNVLLRSVLTEGAEHLSEGDAEIWEEILGDVLLRAADASAGAAGFEEFFQQNWHGLVGAGFASLQVHGQRLLDPDEAILRAALTAAVGALAEAFDQGPPNAETFAMLVQASIGVFADPALLEDELREPWMRDLIASVAGFVRDEGLRVAFSQPALERYARDALEVLSDYPEILVEDAGVVQDLLAALLGGMARADHFGLAALADAAVEATLVAIADNPAQLGIEFSGAVGELAAGLAQRVASGGIGGLHAELILEEVLQAIATNEELFLRARSGLAQAVVGAVLDAADDDPRRLLVGAALVATVERTVRIVAARGRLLPPELDLVHARLREVLAAGLARSSGLLGRRIAQHELPDVLVELVHRVARGDDLPEPGTPEFAALVERIAVQVGARALEEVLG